jgi:putative FmdB family regulatory protein
MPIFEYKCLDCGKITEVLVRTSDEKKPKCEHCGSKKTQKQFSSFAPQVKESVSKPTSGCLSCPNQSCPHSGGLG